MARIIGLGGVFFKSKNPNALSQWYKLNLGLDIDDSFGGCVFKHAQQPEDSYSIWSPFKADTEYFKPSNKDFMINFVTDDVEGMLAKLGQAGAEVHGSEKDEFGTFGWFSDPDGNKIELWQPA